MSLGRWEAGLGLGAESVLCPPGPGSGKPSVAGRTFWLVRRLQPGPRNSSLSVLALLARGLLWRVSPADISQGAHLQHQAASALGLCSSHSVT